jgi:hypothetical protein
VVVLFAGDYSVWRSVRLPAVTARARAKSQADGKEYCLFADDALLDAAPVDLTERLRAAAALV